MTRFLQIIFLALVFLLTAQAEETKKLDSLFMVLEDIDPENKSITIKEISSYLEVKYPELYIDNSNQRSQLALIYEIIGYRYYYYSVLDKADTCLNNALFIYNETEDSSGMARCKQKIALVNTEKGDFIEANKLNYEALQMAADIDDLFLMAESNRNMGINYYYLENYAKSAENYFQALDLYSNLQDTSNVAFVQNALGVLYLRWDAYDKAIQYFNSSEEKFREIQDKRRLSQVVNNKAEIFNLHKKDYEKALELYNESLDIKKDLNDAFGLALTYNNIGTVFGNMGDYDMAIRYLKMSEEKYSKLENQPGLIMVYFNIGNYYAALLNHKKAIWYYTQSLKMAEEIEYSEYISSNYTALIKSYASLGDYEQFMKYYQMEKNRTDSLLSHLDAVEMSEAEAKYHAASVIRENISLKQKVDRYDSNIKRNRLALAGLGTIVLFILTAFIIRLINNKFRKQDKQHH